MQEADNLLKETNIFKLHLSFEKQYFCEKSLQFFCIVEKIQYNWHTHDILPVVACLKLHCFKYYHWSLVRMD